MIIKEKLLNTASLIHVSNSVSTGEGENVSKQTMLIHEYLYVQ